MNKKTPAVKIFFAQTMLMKNWQLPNYYNCFQIWNITPGCQTFPKDFIFEDYIHALIWVCCLVMTMPLFGLYRFHYTLVGDFVLPLCVTLIFP